MLLPIAIVMRIMMILMICVFVCRVRLVLEGRNLFQIYSMYN